MPEMQAQPTTTIDDRTNDLGLFMYAHAYWEAASNLEDASTDSGHSNAPIQFLYCHAVELLMKSYLRSQNLPLKEVRSMRHDLVRVGERAEECGLALSEVDREILGWITESGLTHRYIVTGFTSGPRNESLWRLCLILFQLVGEELIRLDRTKRLPPVPNYPNALRLGF